MGAVSAYQELVASGKIRRQTRSKVDPKIRKQRQAEKSRRQVEAQRRAMMVIKMRHPTEWQEIFDAEMAALNDERGPLPGDEQ